MTHLDDIRARLAAATPGPWFANPWVDGRPTLKDAEGRPLAAFNSWPDIYLAASAPTDIAHLLTLLAERDAQLAAVREFAEWIVSMDDPDPESQGFQDRRTVTLTRIIELARGALDAKGGAS